MAEPHQLVAEIGYDPLGSSIHSWRHALHERCNLRNLHGFPELPEARLSCQRSAAPNVPRRRARSSKKGVPAFCLGDGRQQRDLGAPRILPGTSHDNRAGRLEYRRMIGAARDESRNVEIIEMQVESAAHTNGGTAGIHRLPVGKSAAIATCVSRSAEREYMQSHAGAMRDRTHAGCRSGAAVVLQRPGAIRALHSGNRVPCRVA
jgi:hypothetical protein